MDLRALPPGLAPVLALRDAPRHAPPDVVLHGSPLRGGGRRPGSSHPLPPPYSRAEYLARELGRWVLGVLGPFTDSQ